MKFSKVLALATAVAAVSTLTLTAFADRDFMGELTAEEHTGSAGWAGGTWLVGSDAKCMDNPLTIADLEAADYIEISYESTEIPPMAEGATEGAKLTFCYKFATAVDEDGKATKMEAYLPAGWMEWGPSGETGNTYASMDYFSWDVKEADTLKISCDDILASLKVDKSEILYLWQFGLGNNTYTFDEEWVDNADLGADYYITVTDVKLVGEAAPETDAPATDAPETDAPATDAPATDAPAADEKPNTNTGVEGIALVAGIAVLAAGAVVVSKRK